MELLLGDRDYLSVDYGYADIAFFMAQLFAARLGAPMTERTKRLLAWRARLARRPAVRLIVRQFIKTLQGAGKPAPPFMHEAMADRGKTPPVRGHPA